MNAFGVPLSVTRTVMSYAQALRFGRRPAEYAADRIDTARRHGPRRLKVN